MKTTPSSLARTRSNRGVAQAGGSGHDPCSGHGIGVGRGTQLCAVPQRGGPHRGLRAGSARARGTAHRPRPWPESAFAATAAPKAAANSGATSAGRSFERGEVVVVVHAERFDDPSPDLGFGSVPDVYGEDRFAEVDAVLGELEVEEDSFGLLVLGGGGEHVVGLAGGLGHGDVDDHREVECPHCGAESRRVGQ